MDEIEGIFPTSAIPCSIIALSTTNIGNRLEVVEGNGIDKNEDDDEEEEELGGKLVYGDYQGTLNILNIETGEVV